MDPEDHSWRKTAAGAMRRLSWHAWAALRGWPGRQASRCASLPTRRSASGDSSATPPASVVEQVVLERQSRPHNGLELQASRLRTEDLWAPEQSYGRVGPAQRSPGLHGIQ